MPGKDYDVVQVAQVREVMVWRGDRGKRVELRIFKRENYRTG